MTDISSSNFGLLIAYALPGFIVIWGLEGSWTALAGCSEGVCELVPSLVGFLNSTVAAIAAGLTVSAVRFVIIDGIHERTGLPRPRPNGRVLQENLAAVNLLIDQHYRYYQFHANMIVAGLIAYGVHVYTSGSVSLIPDSFILALLAIFWIAGRDTLRKYYANLDPIFTPLEVVPMSNGMHHPTTTPQPAHPAAASPGKPATSTSNDRPQPQAATESQATPKK